MPLEYARLRPPAYLTLIELCDDLIIQNERINTLHADDERWISPDLKLLYEYKEQCHQLFEEFS